MRTRAFWVTALQLTGLLTASMALSSGAFAQAVEVNNPTSTRVPPRVIELPEILLPEGSAPIEAVEATIVISAEGAASLESSDAPEQIATLIADALTRARFEPATVDGVAVTARVKVRLRVAVQQPPPPPAPSSTGSTNATDGPQRIPDLPAEEAPLSSYAVTGRTKPVPPAARHLEIEEMRDVPGAFGDPFRVLDTLPGVVPVFSGLPYVYVRGAPPASTSYVYDDIAVPLLFHFGVLAAVVHPAMLGDLLFYSSVAPARYGRKTGGVFGAEGPDPNDQVLHGEVEVRLIDVGAMLNVPTPGKGRVMVSGRYGYPGLMLSLVADDVSLAYWDYQVRWDQPIGTHDRFQLAWFGSYDSIGGGDAEQITITYHRAEIRLLHEVRNIETGAALQLGFDKTGIEDGFQVNSARFGPRFWMTWKPSTQVRLRVGADMLATAGSIKADDGSNNSDGEPIPDPSGGAGGGIGGMGGGGMGGAGGGIGGMGGVGGGFAGMGGGFGGDEGGGDDNPLDGGDPISQQVQGRNMMGVYAELHLHPSPQWEFDLGARADLWTTGTTEEHAVEPRVSATYHPTSESDVYIAGGLSYQPAVFPIPIPGLADIALDRGLQRAIQSEVGYRRDFGQDLRIESSLFFSHYSGLMFFQSAFDCGPDDSEDAACAGDGFPRSTSDAYGWEVFIKRPQQHRISGWLSYTLGGATAQGPTGRDFIPDTDVRHFGSAVVQFDLGKNWKLGFRGFGRSGKVASFEDSPLVGRRLPGFARADVMISNRWRTSWGHMRLALEWFNFTLSREPIGFDCLGPLATTECKVEYGPPITIPNIGLRGEF